DDLNDIGDTKIVLRNWLSALDQYVFKNSTESHFKKHGGISAVMYLPDKPEEENRKKEYHYKVLAIHKEGKNGGEMDKLIKNVKKVLTGEIKKEYEKVKDILNENRIYFDFYWKMEEGKDEMDLVWPRMPSDFCLGYYVTVIRPDRAWDIEVNAKGAFLFGADREPMTHHLNLTDVQLQNLWQCCVYTGIFQVEPVTTHSPKQNFIQLVVLKADGKEYRWFLDEKQIPEPILHLLRLLGQYAYEWGIPQVSSYMSHLIVSDEQKL
ncbi:MAG: hypothetical protein KAT65_21745, partial [Methanophagales archaeon]|nr:hypothetical protein [Methanophagales archaeon]